MTGGLVGAVGAVATGRNGRLFLGRQDGFDLGRFTDGSAVPPSFLVQWRATLRRRAAELARRGVPYVFLVAPDAPSVHPEDLPDPYPSVFASPGQIFLEAMGDIPGVHFVYPVVALREARGGLDVYQKTDSHWTTFGSYIAYRELMRTVSRLADCRTVPEPQTRFSFRRSYGDLGAQCEPERSCDIPVVCFTDADPERSFDGTGPERQAAAAMHFPVAPPCRALVFRDSFMTDLAPYLARSFSDTLMLGSTSRLMLDAVDEWHADLVITEVAERRLLAWTSDHTVERHDWLYLSDTTSELGRAMLRALTILRAAPAEAAALVRAQAGSCLAEPLHALSAAMVLEAVGDFAEAARHADACLAARPGDSMALAVRARIALALLAPAHAVSLTARAIAAAPWNGGLHELHVYALLQAGSAGAAAQAAEAAIERIGDHANLWYWASVLRGAFGNPGTGLQAIDTAIALAPDNAEYHAQRARLLP